MVSIAAWRKDKRLELRSARVALPPDEHHEKSSTALQSWRISSQLFLERSSGLTGRSAKRLTSSHSLNNF